MYLRKAALLNSVPGKTLKTRNSPSTTRNWNVDVLLHIPVQSRIGNDRRHFHQLFRQLHIAHSGAPKDIIEQYLVHFENLLRNRQKRVEEAHNVLQLVYHLRHKNIQNLDHGHDVGELLRGALLDPFLWPPRLTQTGWPGTLGGRRHTRPCPSSDLGQGHGHAQTFMPKELSESSLPQAAAAACTAVDIRGWQREAVSESYAKRQPVRETAWVVVVRTLCLYDVSVHATQLQAKKWVAGHPGVRLLATSLPLLRLNGGGQNPGRAPVYTALKSRLMSSS